MVEPVRFDGHLDAAVASDVSIVVGAYRHARHDVVVLCARVLVETDIGVPVVPGHGAEKNLSGGCVVRQRHWQLL